MPRKIALRVYGTSGWDRDAFLMPGVNLKFNDIAFNNFSVVVLNLQAPSVLLGFQVGGIVGHKFLSPYRVSLDLDRSELRHVEGGELSCGLEGQGLRRLRAGSALAGLGVRDRSGRPAERLQSARRSFSAAR